MDQKKTGTERIETVRLILRRLTIEDAENMFNGWCNDPEVTKFLTWPPHGSVEDTRQILGACDEVWHSMLKSEWDTQGK